jgi:hypothetical protein
MPVDETLRCERQFSSLRHRRRTPAAIPPVLRRRTNTQLKYLPEACCGEKRNARSPQETDDVAVEESSSRVQRSLAPDLGTLVLDIEV